MKRAGFTMIELIFVIVILGILAAVALPKFAGVSDQANAQKCNAWAGTLNRTIGPSMWSDIQSQSGGSEGNLTVGTYTIDGTSLVNFVALKDIPASCYGVSTFADGTAAWNSIKSQGTVTFGSNTYEYNFTDGTLSESPRWSWKIQ